MNKRLQFSWTIVLSVMCVAAALTSPCFAQEAGAGAIKIGVVDRKAVMDGFTKAKAEYDELQEEVDELQKGIDALSTKIEDAKDKYDKEKNNLTPEERIEREDAIQRDYREYQTELKNNQAEIDSKELRLMKRLFSEIDEAVKQIGSEQGYQLVLEGSENSRSGVIFFSPTIDMSQRVIDLLNSK